MVTEYSAISFARYVGSLCPSGLAMTSRAPFCRPQKNSQTDTSKVIAICWSTTSSVPRPYSDCFHTSWLTIARCVSSTPFGLPVDPDVNIT